jgi:hypothetical protein
MTILTLTLLVIVRIMIMGCWDIIISLASSKEIEIRSSLVLKRKILPHFENLAKSDLWPRHIWAKMN